MSVFATGRDDMNGADLYPEYLTDIKILVCPSDAETSAQVVQDIFDIAANGDPEGLWTQFAPAPLLTNPQVKKFVQVQLLGRSYSYAYLPWATTTNGNLLALASGWNTVRNQKCGGGARGTYCNYDHDITNINLTATNAAYTTNWVPPEQPVFQQGSGGGTTLYRLKDGIERFFITDINNPAGSAMAQSTIPVKHDLFAGTLAAGRAITTRMQSFNHVPGGANVLYMDGHVEFLKYPGKYPLTHFYATHSSSGEGNPSNPVIDTAFFQYYTPL
jgi:prepilin-type processing-associated H-X9-DG protein